MAYIFYFLTTGKGNWHWNASDIPYLNAWVSSHDTCHVRKLKNLQLYDYLSGFPDGHQLRALHVFGLFFLVEFLHQKTHIAGTFSATPPNIFLLARPLLGNHLRHIYLERKNRLFEYSEPDLTNLQKYQEIFLDEKATSYVPSWLDAVGKEINYAKHGNS